VDIPDRIIGDDVKLWRFRAMVLPELDHSCWYHIPSLVNVYSGNTVVGCVNLELQDREIWGDFKVDYSIPPRLDVQAGNRIWCLPNVRISWGEIEVVTVESVILSTDCTSDTHLPISPNTEETS
jgi:hypothetical protein